MVTKMSNVDISTISLAETPSLDSREGHRLGEYYHESAIAQRNDAVEASNESRGHHRARMRALLREFLASHACAYH